MEEAETEVLRLLSSELNILAEDSVVETLITYKDKNNILKESLLICELT